MQAIEIEIDIGQGGELKQIKLPTSFRQWYGNHAKVMLIFPDLSQRSQTTEQRWRELLQQTQQLPQTEQISLEEINAEVTAYRQSQ
ncbi:MAG: hypothetical protein HQL49_01445 [Gammaproteobacteria bacterium]|nr:hypothetical protein [Gammaproteobacteria bacterium]